MRIDGFQAGTLLLRREPKIGSRIYLSDPLSNGKPCIVIVEGIDDSVVRLKRESNEK